MLTATGESLKKEAGLAASQAPPAQWKVHHRIVDAYQNEPHSDSTPSLAQLIQRIPGKSPLDLTMDNVTDYCCGSFALIERDFTIVLSESIAKIVIDAFAKYIPSAFRLREELINMKKLAYHVHRQSAVIERSLAQLSTFFWEDHSTTSSTTNSTGPKSWVHSDRFTTITDARMRCKGSCAAATDARSLAKQICCISRHPDKGRPSKLQQLPHGLETAAFVRDADNFLQLNRTSTNPCVYEGVWINRAHETINGLAQSSEHGLSSDTITFVSNVIICRGANKALRMVDEVKVAKGAVECVISYINSLLPILKDCEEKLTDEVVRMIGSAVDEHDISLKMGSRVLCHRHINLLSGCLPQLLDLQIWLEKINEIADSGSLRVLFLASDSCPERHTLPAAMNLPMEARRPDDAASLLAGYRTVEAQYRPELRKIIATKGWPLSIADRLGATSSTDHQSQGKVSGVCADASAYPAVPNNKVCRFCSKVYSSLWVHLGVCCECENRVRTEENRCPFRTACKAAWFCPHAAKCLICDAHSCEECRLLRGDSETVISLAARLRPYRIAFDFDRTLASTKSGAKPLLNKHAMDVDLLSLMWTYSCTIVTRNQNKEDIRAFITTHGAPLTVEIHTVGKKESKANYVIERVAEEINPSFSETRTVLFVDDSIQELTDPLIVNATHVYRVLFVRALA